MELLSPETETETETETEVSVGRIRCELVLVFDYILFQQRVNVVVIVRSVHRSAFGASLTSWTDRCASAPAPVNMEGPSNVLLSLLKTWAQCTVAESASRSNAAEALIRILKTKTIGIAPNWFCTCTQFHSRHAFHSLVC